MGNGQGVCLYRSVADVCRCFDNRWGAVYTHGATPLGFDRYLYPEIDMPFFFVVFPNHILSIKARDGRLSLTLLKTPHARRRYLEVLECLQQCWLLFIIGAREADASPLKSEAAGASYRTGRQKEVKNGGSERKGEGKKTESGATKRGRGPLGSPLVWRAQLSIRRYAPRRTPGKER